MDLVHLYGPEFLDGVFEALRHVVDVLIGLVVILLNGGRAWVEVSILGGI